jgi:phosphatidylserine/phosphatidylglycerophosphate/cardiolipin synthase-like enzyme
MLQLALQACTSGGPPVSATDQPAALEVVISEIAWMGTTNSPNDEWVELFNNSDSEISLSGWSLTAADGTPSVQLMGLIPAGGYFLLERTDDDSVPGVPADQIYTGTLSDAGEDLFLHDADSNVMDRINATSGWFAGHLKGRVPMERVSSLADGSQERNWRHSPRCGTATNSAASSRICTLTLLNVGSPLDFDVHFNDLATTATEITGSRTMLEEELLALIADADTRIDAAIYGLNRQSVVEALIAAHNRGVVVRVVGDLEAATGVYSDSYAALTSAGITVITDDTASKIQHNKFLVFDGEVVWTGSTNLTDTGLTLNANNSIVIADEMLGSIYLEEFEEMWTGSFHADKTDNTTHLLDYSGTVLKSFFSPTDLVAFEVRDELADADETVHFAMFFFTDDVLSQRLMDRLEAGVEVFGVWDRLGAANAFSADEELCDAGAQVKIEDFAGKVHHKFAVIDVEGQDPTVILGSYNWTGSGSYDNDENTLIIHDRLLARRYLDEWNRLWDAIEEEPCGAGGP